MEQSSQIVKVTTHIIKMSRIVELYLLSHIFLAWLIISYNFAFLHFVLTMWSINQLFLPPEKGKNEDCTEQLLGGTALHNIVYEVQ